MTTIPIPYIEKPIEPNAVTKEYVDWFLNVPNWICPCGATNFGRNKYCPACQREHESK